MKIPARILALLPLVMSLGWADPQIDFQLLQTIERGSPNDLRSFLASHPGILRARTLTGTLPLIQACHSKASPEIIQVLLRAGADPNQADSNGFTPLQTALVAANPAIVKVLLDHRADPNRPDYRGLSPLCQLGSLGNRRVAASMVPMLVKAGATVQPRDAKEPSPLALAISSGVMDDAGTAVLVAALLKSGADPNQRLPYEGGSITVSELAQRFKLVRVAQALREAGGH